MIHAHILLKSDKGEWGPRWRDKQIQEAFEVGETLVKKVRKRYVEEGLDAALNRKKAASTTRKAKN